MCGRYGRWSGNEWLVEEFSDIHLPTIPFPATYNAAPQSLQPVVRLNAGGVPELVPMPWGLIPFWVQQQPFTRSVINARAEHMEQKPTFRQALQSRHGGDKISASSFRCCGCIRYHYRRCFQGLLKRVFDVVKPTHFHALHDKRFSSGL